MTAVSNFPQIFVGFAKNEAGMQARVTKQLTAVMLKETGYMPAEL